MAEAAERKTDIGPPHYEQFLPPVIKSNYGKWKYHERIKPGVLINTNLNRIPQLSTMLKVYDGKQQLIAEAKVVDSHATQASIEIVSAYTTTPDAFASWTVVSHKAFFNAGFD